MPIISVIVPIYKVERYLEKCIQSIQDQTLKDIEIILVDDGSPDRCGVICDEFAQNDSRITVIHKENGGVSSARNLGIRIANGEYIGFVDGDDWIDKDMYEVLYDGILKTNAEVAICGYRIEHEGNITQFVKNDGKTIVYTKEEAVRKILIDEEIHSFTWNKLIKKELFIDFESPKLYYHQDYASTFILFDRAKKIVMCRKAKYTYNNNDGSTCFNLSPLRLYHSFLALQIRQKFIEENYTDLTELNLARLFTHGIIALHSMVRTNVYKTTLREEYATLCLSINNNLSRILKNSKLALRVKIYCWLVTKCPSGYIVICKIDFFKKLRKIFQYNRFQILLLSSLMVD